ncbi:GDP-mannose pyrophosphatase NudK, partial [Salmonella sp. zj-f60]|nr:GDP-mannose pyrophosphatase NudK [Salmonella sp. zj-f60]
MSSKIENIKNQLLSDNWYVLRKYTYDLIKRNGE